MSNLDQLRAAHARSFWNANQDANAGEEGGDVVSGLPALLINNGLLATAAFAKAKGGGHLALLQNVLRHVAEACPPALPRQGPNSGFDALLDTLVSGSSLQLQQATAEALAYLSYLKRFAP